MVPKSIEKTKSVQEKGKKLAIRSHNLVILVIYLIRNPTTGVVMSL